MTDTPLLRRERQAPAARLLFVNQHYWPDVAATAQHLTDLAEHCAALGFEVEVLCGRGAYAEGEARLPTREVRKGVTIKRLRTTSFGRGTVVGRLLDYAGYYVGVLRALLAGPASDLTILLTTPPLLSVAGAVARRLRGRRYAVWSMDLHPDAEVGLGMLDARGLLARTLESLNRIGYRSADFVVALGFRMRERIEAKGVPSDRIRTISPWCDAEEVGPIAPADNPVRRDLGLDADRVVVMYSGNAGLAHRFDEVLDAADRLRGDRRFLFLFVGSGPRRAEIEAFVAERGLDNVRYRGYFPLDELTYSLSAGDLHLLTLREEMAGIAVPSKLYGIMAAGRPSVMVGPRRSEPALAIETHDAGVVIDPADGGDPAGRLVEALQELADDPALRAAIGARARVAFEAHHEREGRCRAWADAIYDQLGLIPEPADVAEISG